MMNENKHYFYYYHLSIKAKILIIHFFGLPSGSIYS